MKKIYYLSTCDTCNRILDKLQVPGNFELQDIKKQPLSPEEVEHLKKFAGNYEALFSKRARLYKERDLKNKDLTEENYKNLLLEHYTFLKRPVVLNDSEIFIGNSKKTIEEAKVSLHG